MLLKSVELQNPLLTDLKCLDFLMVLVQKKVFVVGFVGVVELVGDYIVAGMRVLVQKLQYKLVVDGVVEGAVPIKLNQINHFLLKL